MHKVAIASDAVGARFINLSEAGPVYSAALVLVFDPSAIQKDTQIDGLFSAAAQLAKHECRRQDEPRRNAEYEAAKEKVDAKLADLETNGIPDEMKQRLREFLAANP
jgi:hypothetical protein